jgi:7,8-dihydropterin-6-yl-methyl-4-(beta-D-ribofuranosyl)aminobenzene 5'-phosphate synthase
LVAQGARVVSTRDARLIIDDMAYVSGEIPRVTGFERGLRGQHRRTLDGSGWELDELIMDERFVAVNVRSKGIVVLTACSHAGVVNVLEHARTCFGQQPIYAVVGGLHLTGSNEQIIPETIAGIREVGVTVIAPGHCTGWRAVNAFAQAFGEHTLAPLAVGKRLTF